MKPAAGGFLQFSLPETVEVAVGEDRLSLIIMVDAEEGLGLVRGVQAADQEALEIVFPAPHAFDQAVARTEEEKGYKQVADGHKEL